MTEEELALFTHLAREAGKADPDQWVQTWLYQPNAIIEGRRPADAFAAGSEITKARVYVVSTIDLTVQDG